MELNESAQSFLKKMQTMAGKMQTKMTDTVEKAKLEQTICKALKDNEITEEERAFIVSKAVEFGITEEEVNEMMGKTAAMNTKKIAFFDKLKVMANKAKDSVKQGVSCAKDKISDTTCKVNSAIDARKLDKLIDKVLVDGVISEEERAFIINQATELGISKEEAEKMMCEAEKELKK